MHVKPHAYARGPAGQAETRQLNFPPAGQHLETNISQVYNGLDVSFDSYPADDVGRDAEAYRAAIDALSPGDAITIFTPDTTHYAIALYAIERGVHVLLTKPAVKTVAEQQAPSPPPSQRPVQPLAAHCAAP